MTPVSLYYSSLTFTRYLAETLLVYMIRSELVTVRLMNKVREVEVRCSLRSLKQLLHTVSIVNLVSYDSKFRSLELVSQAKLMLAVTLS